MYECFKDQKDENKIILIIMQYFYAKEITLLTLCTK